MRAALSSQEFARKCFGLEASLKDTYCQQLESKKPNPEASQSGVREAAVGLRRRQCGASLSRLGEIN
jgi:hypothetical protein